jgi:hypothetical protein
MRERGILENTNWKVAGPDITSLNTEAVRIKAWLEEDQVWDSTC